MLTLGDFYTTVRDALGRGTALDAVIAANVRKSVRWIERNVDPGYLYMQKFGTLTLTSSGTYPHVIDVPHQRMKAILFFRLVGDDNDYTYLHKIDPREVNELDTAQPAGYWLDGTTRIILDAKPDEDYTAEMQWVEYSSWNIAETHTHWLLDNAEDLLFAQTMLAMAPYTRDPKLVQTYKLLRDEALVTLEGARINTDTENADYTMNYGG